MSTPDPPDWKSTATFRNLIAASPWKQDPFLAVVLNKLVTAHDAGLPDRFQDWHTTNKCTYAILLEQSGDPDGMATAFGLRYQPWEALAPEAEKHAKRIAEVFPELLLILQKAEGTIRSRWAKKNARARAQLLVEAAGEEGIAQSHRPDLEILRKKLPGPCRRDFLVPFLTVEDLTKGMTFLRLLNARGRNEPSTFRYMDLNTIQLGMRTEKLPFHYFLTVMDLSSPVSSGNYGRVDDPVASGVLRLLVDLEVAASEGMLVLELQSRMLTFLLECCRLILGAAMVAGLKDDEVAVQSELAPLPPHDDHQGSILGAGLQRPYQNPATACCGGDSLQEILGTARAALEEARDHLVALREDPGYFANTMAEHKEHSLELVKDVQGRPHPDVNKAGGVFLTLVVNKMLEESYMEVLGWEIATKLLEQAVEAERRYSSSGLPNELEDVPYSQLLVTLRAVMERALLRDALARATTALIADPSRRGLWWRPQPTSLRPERKPGATEDQTFWLMRAGANHYAAENRGELPTIGVVDILVEIQRFVEANQSRKQKLSPFTMRTLAKASLIADLRSRLTSTSPLLFSLQWGFGFSRASFTDGQAAEARALSTNPVYSKADAFFQVKNFPKLGPFVDPRRHEFKYPVDKKRTAQTVATLQLAEANLVRFWNAFDRAVASSSRPLNLYFQSMTGFPQVLSTPDWVEPPPKQKKKTAAAASDEFDLAAHLNAQADIAGRATSPPGGARQRKPKIKTRGQADPGQTRVANGGQAGQEGGGQQNDAATLPPPPPKPVFELNKRGMKAVRVLFHHPGETDQPGQLVWTDFVTGMAQMGFSVEAHYGSAFCFTPSGESLTALSRQSIVIHGPHPGPKLGFATARGVGRRLTNRYGLDAASFRLKKADRDVDDRGSEVASEDGN